MSTISTKHVANKTTGDPPMTVMSGSILVDDMDIIRKLCLPEKHDISLANASHLTFGIPCGPSQTSHQRDFVNPGLAQREPKSVRDARSQYMNNPHFQYGYENEPMVSLNQTTFRTPARHELMHRPAGTRDDKNASSLFSCPADRAAWADNLETTNRVDYIAPGVGDTRLNAQNRKADHRSTHYVLGTDPIVYKSFASECYQPPVGFVRQEPVKAAPCGVQLGTKDYPWHKDLMSTNQMKFAPHRPEECDALTEFMKKGPPIQFGDDKREMLTEHRAAYKNIEYLDCSKLTNEQLEALGVTREQIIPRKIPLPFVASQLFKNSMGHSFGEQY